MEKLVKSNSQKIREMTILAMFIAIIAVLALVPGMGFFVVGPISISYVHIIVMIGGVFLGKVLGRKAGMILGTAMGICSLIASFYMIAHFNNVFNYPWVSVLPRFLFGIVIYDVTNIFKKVIKKRIFAYIVSFFLLSVIHSLLVLPLLFVSYPLYYGATPFAEMLAMFSGKAEVMTGILVISGIVLVEAVFSGIVGGVVTDRLQHYLDREEDTPKSKEEDNAGID
ncbi:MAG: ECF transporter S component [Candidatus Izemoplasmatales bacterium]